MRVLILRTSAMGDIVHSLPVLASLKREMPGVKLAWVVERPFAPLLYDRGELDQVIEVELRRWRRAPVSGLRAMARARRALDDFGADLALDLMGNHKAGALAALARASRVLGLRREDRREPSSALWMTETVPAHGVHTVDRTLSILRGLDLAPGEVDFRPESILPGPGDPAPPESDFFVMQIGSGWPNKTYPDRAWGEVAKRITERQGVVGYVAHGPDDDDAAETAIVASDGALAGRVPGGLTNLGPWLRAARLVLGGDTGPVHLADALGVPVLMVMGPTDAGRNGPYNQPHNTIAVTLPCRPCYKRFRAVQSCMTHLPAAVIAERAVRLLCGQELTPPDTLLRLSEPLPPLCRSLSHEERKAIDQR